MPVLLAASAMGWMALLCGGHDTATARLCGVSILTALSDPQFWRAMVPAFVPQQHLASCGLMLLATMPPLLAHPIAHLWDRSFKRRRYRAIALFLSVYSSVWLAASLAAAISATIVQGATGIAGWRAAALTAGIALSWHATPAKQACLNRCHRLPPLAAFGLAADRDCLRFGLRAAAWCIGSCWALMLVPLLTDRARLPVMLAVALVLASERLAGPRPARWGRPFRSAAALVRRLRPTSGSGRFAPS